MIKEPILFNQKGIAVEELLANLCGSAFFRDFSFSNPPMESFIVCEFPEDAPEDKLETPDIKDA